MTTIAESTTSSTAKHPHLFRIHPPTAVPCPTWCNEPAGHSYDMQDPVDGAQYRQHGHVFGTREVGADVVQPAAWRDAVETPDGAPEIRVWVGGSAAEEAIETPQNARALAAALLEAADLLEALQ